MHTEAAEFSSTFQLRDANRLLTETCAHSATVRAARGAPPLGTDRRLTVKVYPVGTASMEGGRNGKRKRSGLHWATRSRSRSGPARELRVRREQILSGHVAPHRPQEAVI